MPVGAYPGPQTSVGNGVTTVFPYNFRILASTDLRVALDGVTQSSGYSVSGVGDESGGNVTFSVAPASGVVVLRERAATYDRTDSDYQRNGAFQETSVDRDFDRPIMLIQQLKAISDRSIRAPAGETLGELPDADSRASMYLGFDADGNPGAYDPASGAVADAANVNYSSGSTGAISRTVKDHLQDFRSAFEFMSSTQKSKIRAGTGDTIDVVDALITALDVSIDEGCVIVMPPGDYRCDAILKPTTAGTFHLRGAGSRSTTTYGGITNILGMHDDDAVLSLRGCVGCTLDGINFFGQDSTTCPKTLLLLARAAGAGSAGWHVLTSLGFHGRWSVAGIFESASEGNTWQAPYMNLASGAAAGIGWYLSSGDGTATTWATETPTGSTMLGSVIINPMINLLGTVADASCIFIDGSEALGSIAMFGGYFVQQKGNYITIRTGSIDGKDTHGAITIIGAGGEQPDEKDHPNAGDNTPLSALNLVASAGAPTTIHGLHVEGRFHLNAGEALRRDAYARLGPDAYINITAAATPLADPPTNRSSTVGNFGAGAGTNDLGARINVGFGLQQQRVQVATLAGTWTSTYATGNNLDAPGYFKDTEGFVYLTGAVGDGTSSTTIFTLPSGYRPTNNKHLAVSTNTGDGQITISASTGDVTHLAGGTDPVLLDGIVFRAG